MKVFDIDKSIMVRAFHNAIIETLEKKYKTKGYEVQREFLIENYRADLFCKKDDDVVVIEVRAIGARNNGGIEKLISIKNKIERKYKYKFVIEYFKLPVNHLIKIDNVEDMIFDQVSSNIISELDVLSTHTRPQEITDVEILSIHIMKESCYVEGKATIIFELQWGSDSDLEKDDGDKEMEEKEIVFTMTIIKGCVEHFDYSLVN